MSSKKYLSYDDCYILSKMLAQNLITKISENSFELKGLVAILNGGLIPTYYIRKVLKLHHINTRLKFVDISSYDDTNKQGVLTIHDKPTLDHNGKGWVFIDEVCDTGETVAALKNIYPEAFFISLSVKQKGKYVIDMFAQEHRQDEWIVYPWEVAEAG